MLHLELQEAQLKPGRLIVVGDVHGCCDELELLLERCGACELDNLVLVGDLVNKGPKSCAVLDLVQARRCWAVRGNHDEAALQSHRLWQQRQPIKERWAWVQELQPRQLEVLGALPFSLSIPAYGVLVVHAGGRGRLGQAGWAGCWGACRMPVGCSAGVADCGNRARLPQAWCPACPCSSSA